MGICWCHREPFDSRTLKEHSSGYSDEISMGGSKAISNMGCAIAICNLQDRVRSTEYGVSLYGWYRPVPYDLVTEKRTSGMPSSGNACGGWKWWTWCACSCTVRHGKLIVGHGSGVVDADSQRKIDRK